MFMTVTYTHLKELLWLPHAGGQTLEGNVHRRDRVAAQQLRFVALQYPKCDTEQDVESVEEQDVPHAEQRLRQIR